jgi:hypothetical protein
MLDRQLDKHVTRVVNAIENARARDSCDWRAIVDRPRRHTVAVLGEYESVEFESKPFLATVVRELAHDARTSVQLSFHQSVSAGALLVSLDGGSLEHVRVGYRLQNWMTIERGRGPFAKLLDPIPIGVTLEFQLCAD